MESDRSCTEDDINSVFDSIVLTEEKVSRKSYEEGYKQGVSEGQVEGYHLGYHRGCELGYEIGFYKGFIKVVSSLHDIKSSDKVMDAVAKLSKLVDDFPSHNVKSRNFINLRDEIRVRYKRICSLLKIENTLPVSDNLTF